MTPRDKHKTAKPRINRAGVVLFYLALATAIAWLAAARWNGSPALEQRVSISGWFPGPPITPARDRTKQLVAAFNSMPPVPPFSLPAPPRGMRWAPGPRPTTVFLSDALQGRWTPPTRPHLRAVIEYIASPGVETALTQLADIKPGVWRPFGPDGPGLAGLSSMRRSVKTLVTHARYNHEEKGDVDAAFSDIEAAYTLSGTAYGSGEVIGVLTAMACESLVHSEIIQLACERRFRPAQAGRAASILRVSTLENAAIWQKLVDAQVGEFEWALDTSYTNDGHGDGWLALSYLNATVGPWWATPRRCGAWNVFSPLFNSRRTVTRKIAEFRTAYEDIPALQYSEAQAALRNTAPRAVFNVADGPLAPGSTSTIHLRIHELLTRNIARRHSVLIAVALSAYRYDNGQYPPSLDELIGRYLEDVPPDPYDNQSLRYIKKSNDDYVLYAIGPNLLDDGGTEPSEWGRLDEEGDFITTRPRSQSNCDPALERIQP